MTDLLKLKRWYIEARDRYEARGGNMSPGWSDSRAPGLRDDEYAMDAAREKWADAVKAAWLQSRIRCRLAMTDHALTEASKPLEAVL